MERIHVMRNKSERRRSSRVVWQDYARELPEVLWNAEISRIYGIYETFGEELIFKRVKGRIAIRPYTATRNGGSRRYTAKKRAFGRCVPDCHSELKIAEILPPFRREKE